MKLTSTVIVATYNGSKYIHDQLASIDDQVVRPTKVIIRDDQSTDKTAEIVSRYIKEKDLSGSWDFKVNAKRKGWRRNFVDMYDQAETDIVFLSDQDDMWKRDKVADYLKCFAEEKKAEVLVSDYSFLPRNQKILPMASMPEVGQNGFYRVLPDIANILIRRDGCTIAMRKSIIETAKKVFSKVKIDSNGLPQSHDQAIWIAGLMRGSLYHLKKPLMLRRAHADSTWQLERKNHQNHFAATAEENPNYIDFLKAIDHFLLHDHSSAELPKNILEKVLSKRINESQGRTAVVS